MTRAPNGIQGTNEPRRQWGSDRRTPLPRVAEPPTDGSLTRNRVAIVVTVAAWAVYVVTTVAGQVVASRGHGTSLRFMGEAFSYVAVVSMLTWSAVAYLLARQGFLHRTKAHRRTPRAVIDEFYEGRQPSLTVLVPSYREEARVIRQTLLSAALQEYPSVRVVLLLDDPPAPSDPEHRSLLDEARRLPSQIEGLLAVPADAARDALQRFEDRTLMYGQAEAFDVGLLVSEYERAARWLRDNADVESAGDHTDRFLAGEVLERLASDLQATAQALRTAAGQGVAVPAERMRQLYRRLVWIFDARLSSFERKAFASLSHEPNKAMNLNSYIGLMGGRYRQERTPEGRVLRPMAPGASGHADLVVPDPDYVLTLDADSVLLPEYCLRLVYLMEQPGQERTAVAQTPYSAYPGSTTRIERLAGATTDLQHIVHQGLTHYDATFWVGANAVLRKRALDDISEVDDRGAYAISRFIQDRTVIEDTESSVDLGARGWKLVNYPERLSYSATPPDFGSLSIQRQRWANGGLLILGKLWRAMRHRRHGAHRVFGVLGAAGMTGVPGGERMRMSEAFLRVNYMASICWASFGLGLLLVYPYTDRLLSPLVLVTALPYFLAMASDLARCGYKRLDVLRIYGFNLVLLPVNLSGVCKSIGQALTGRKIAFARTPKIRNRTTAPLTFVLMPYLLVAWASFTFVGDVRAARWAHAAFSGANALLASYAIVAYIGIRHSLEDVWMNVVSRLYRPDPSRAALAKGESVAADGLDWEAVLYLGDTGTASTLLATARDARSTRTGAEQTRNGAMS